MYYFIYSKAQQTRQEEAYKKGGKTYIPGKVTVNGKTNTYTSIVQDLRPVQELFGDIKVVTMSETLARVKYTKPSFNKIRRVI